MQQLVKSASSLSWALPLFTLQQAANAFRPSSDGSMGGDAVAACDALTKVSIDHCGQSIRQTFKAGDKMQRDMVDMMFRLVPMGGSQMPGMSMPGMSMPGSSMPGSSMPGACVPRSPMAGMPMAGMSMAGMSMPGMSMPGMSMPGASMPGMSRMLGMLGMMNPMQMLRSLMSRRDDTAQVQAAQPEGSESGWGPVLPID